MNFADVLMDASYVSLAENLTDRTLGAETPGAAPTLQKRGPWRPHRTGRQGRLPNCKANPRRGLLSYLTTYTDINDALFQIWSVSAVAVEIRMLRSELIR